jgi:hypothetical protein
VELWWLQSGLAATALNVVLLVALVLILVNLEQTFRAAVGTMRWRIKFVVVGLVLIFGARLYVRSQAILFSAPDITLWNVESGALLIGCFLLTAGYVRTRWVESDVYPSLAVMRSSLTIVVVGGYLFVVGILGQLVSRFGGDCRAHRHRGPGRRAAVRSAKAEGSCVRSSTFQQGAARLGADLEPVLPAAHQRDGSRKPLFGIGEAYFRKLRRLISRDLAAGR